ncbi:AzlC family ABC transporter permease [Corynebacterium bovis]|uniref:AzlC family ABC transporter permease n=2 Tax=Corynebacterium bovis TaxID=36808 RepID=UPI000F65068C|nr:AzlC family ABC transporter permease [Corynebacterium bovis]RRO80264.1 branched-chain amino acid ABC transporter permease [Corynebacterium bovis]RRO82316.1 branched-chain amino acid ABC transporter permease [Corynebacterium bovis]RRO83792.1 branched-chain amino acid ABC transporter permease [Corynebacterium bovis]RRO91177.1 branched-chain amino acid ABC transporter permease [Corynebacterium bovis]RRO95695.1 branched-chain amino acid ABC transporter permease [Corynebacterium bovis]
MTNEDSPRRGEIAAGLADAWTVALGLVPLGLAFGLLVTQSGFAWWWAPVFSVVIYAGSMEFLAVSLVTGGVAPAAAALYGLLVNFRHVFYGLSFPTGAVRNPLARAYGVYALTDETYAVLSARPGVRWTGARVITVEVVCQVAWVGSGVVAALVGSAVPPVLHGMDFALTALFAVLLIESFDAARDLSLPVSAAVCGVVGYLVSPSQMLVIGLVLYFLLLVARHRWTGFDVRLRWTVGSPAGGGEDGGGGGAGVRAGGDGVGAGGAGGGGDGAAGADGPGGDR